MENNTIHILPNTCYIMSGPPCSGKSTFLKSVVEQGADPTAIICPDTIRETIFGAKPFIDDNGIGKSLYGWYYEADKVFEIVKIQIKARLAQGLQVFLDATNLTDSERKLYADIFIDYKTPFQVLIFNEDSQVIAERLKKRDYRFEQQANIIATADKLQKDSIYPHAVIDSSYKPLFVNALTSFTNFIVVGDTHGLKEPLIELLAKDGFIFDGKQFTHPEKKVLFLGDVVARGDNSLELLDIVKNTVYSGNGWMIKGNHEIQLLRAIDGMLSREELLSDMSISTTQTLKEFCQFSDEKRQEIFGFLRSLPYSLSFLVNKETLQGENFEKHDDSQIKIAFGHSPLNYFHPTRTLGEELAYNQIPYEFDIQEGYEKAYLMAQNKYIYIHARHINSEKFEATSIYSINDAECFGGNLVSFGLNEYLKNLKENDFVLNKSIFESATKKQPSNYDFTIEHAKTIALKNGIAILNQGGFFDKAQNGDTHKTPMGLRMYVRKNTNKEPDNKELLEKCNGLVLDTGAGVIAMPRIEMKNTLGLSKDEKVYSVPHSNHNIFYVYRNPYNDALEISTSKGFNKYKEDIEFVNGISDKLYKFFDENNATLGFETRLVHNGEEDSSEELGFDYVLTFGQENDITSTPFSEDKLNEIGNFIEVTRPFIATSTMEDVRIKARTTNGLGYTVRKVSDPEKIYYIPSDLVMFQTISDMLMDDNNARFFFNKPELFINKFFTEDMKCIAYGIADSTSLDNFLKMSEEDRKMTIFHNMHPEDKIIDEKATARSLESEKNMSNFSFPDDPDIPNTDKISINYPRKG